MADQRIFGMNIEINRGSVDFGLRRVSAEGLAQVQGQVWRHARGTWTQWTEQGDGLANMFVALHATDRFIVLELVGEKVDAISSLAWENELDLIRFRLNCDQAVLEVFQMFVERQWERYVMATPTDVLRPTHRHW